MSNLTLKILPALMVAITAALVTQPMRAGVIDTLVITENSSTSLSAILNGTTTLTVTNTSPDHWTINLPGIAFPPSGGQLWVEPDAAGFVNVVSRVNVIPDHLFVTSDEAQGTRLALADGTQDTTTFALNGNNLFVTFFDKGDVATTPMQERLVLFLGFLSWAWLSFAGSSSKKLRPFGCPRSSDSLSSQHRGQKPSFQLQKGGQQFVRMDDVVATVAMGVNDPTPTISGLSLRSSVMTMA